MALAGLAQGAIIDMNGQSYHHPKFVGTFRKVDAGLVKAAGTPCFCPIYTSRQEDTLAQLIHSVFSTCRYLHVLQPEAAAAVRRRGSAPNVSFPRGARTPSDRGPEPATPQVTIRQECNTSETVVDSPHTQHNSGRLASDTEEQSHGT